MNNSSYFKKPFGTLSKTLFLFPALSLLLTGFYDDLSDPNTEDFAKEIQSSVALPEPNISIKQLKLTYCSNNGKVERQHRIDQQRFYDRLRMFCLEDGRKQLAVYQKKSNDYIKHCLGLRSPNQVLADYMAVM